MIRYSNLTLKIYLSFILIVFSLFSSAQTITLNISIAQGDYEKVMSLLDHGYSPNGTDQQGNISVNVATYHNNQEILKVLLDYGADINGKDRRGNFPLLFASLNNRIELLQFIINQGAIIDMQSDYGRTALMYVTVANPDKCLEVIELLHRNGADLNIIDKFDKTALDYATNQEVIDFLIFNGGLYSKEIE